MKKTYHRLWIPLLAALMGCHHSRSVIEIGEYSFNYGGKTYRIESVTPTYLEGYNVLTQREGDKLVLKAVDKEQDGVLDELIIGQISLKQANVIYEEGIAAGKRQGSIKMRTFTREYRTSDQIYHFTLATYILARGEIYNKLTVVNKVIFKEDGVVLDKDADGRIDEVEKGFDSMGKYQDLYEEVLKKGLEEAKVKMVNNKYLVVQ